MSICAECAELGLDCCHVQEGQGIAAGLTVADVCRIVLATGIPPKHFVVLETVSDAELASVSRAQFVDLIFAHKLRIGLDLKRGPCPFLTTRGCSLGVMTRPRYCALFPCGFDPDDDFALYPFYGASPDHCLAVKRAKGDPERLFQLLGTHPRVLMQIAKFYHEELKRHARTSVADLQRLCERDVAIL